MNIQTRKNKNPAQGVSLNQQLKTYQAFVYFTAVFRRQWFVGGQRGTVRENCD